ncbi:hypothetical protein [Acinetobacter sp. YH01005]|uniref:hypothetical protein n=1 Tax=Acinetobacter sp. YH01005 TaxID=2601021 RepID=UPI0015D2DCE8|nr:hypothetical protein [Acinetobacter sp. YH01005]
MKLNIKLTNEDFYVFQVLNEELINPVIYDKFEVKFLRLVFKFFILLIVGLFIFIFFKNDSSLLNYLIVLVALLLGLLPKVNSLFQNMFKIRYIDHMAENSKIFIGDKEIEITEKNLIESTEYYTQIFSWSLVSNIEKTQTHLIVFFGICIGIILPLDQINNDVEKIIQQYCPNIEFKEHNW